MEKKLLSMLVALFVFVGIASAQTSKVTGVVTTIEGGVSVPVIGATVVVKGTNPPLGMITDFDGVFTIENVPSHAKTLVVSYVGLRTEEVAIAPGKLSIVLRQDSKVMDEVVVTAMGIQRQAKAIGYATAKVDNEELTMAKGSDATAALSGKVSGLQINVTSAALDQETRVTLRGARSFKGDNSALLVLDGVQTPINFLQTLNPNDIENISVLKGASAAALYGSEAANGVLLVTTKTGAKGKPNVTYSLTTTMTEAAYFPKFQTRFGAGQTDDLSGMPTFNSMIGASGYYSDENQQYGPEFDGELINVGSPLFDGSAKGYYLQMPYAYVDGGRTSFYETGYGIQNDISYSSSDERGSMYLSYQRLDQSGIISGDESVRQTVRLNASRNYKNFRASAKVAYTHATYDVTNDSNAGIYNLLNVPGNYNVADYKNWREENGTGAHPNEWINDYYDNPWFNIDTYRRETRQDRLVGSIDLDYQALPWLRFTGRAGLNLGVNNNDRKTYAFRYSDWAADNIYYASTDQYSAYNTASRTNSRFNLDFMAFANHKFSEDFEMKAMVGWSLQDYFSEFKYAAAASLALDDFFNLKNKVGELTGSNNWSRSRKMGVFGSIDFSWKDWAFLQLTARNDWTSLLDPSNWSFFYPSANASVVMTDAIPSLKSDVFNHFKMRASAAKVGTVNLAPYQLENTAATADGFPFGTLAAYSLSSTLYSRDLEPEFTTEYEIGAEFGLFRNRITLEAAAYFQKTTNQTVAVSIPTSTGFSSRYINAGTMEGRGIELDLRLNPLIRINDFTWNMSFNATFLETKVTELAGGATELVLDSNFAGYAILGQKFPQAKATDWKRNSEGKVIVDPKTGMPSAGDIIACGTTDPTIRLGMSSNMKWKGFTLGATFDYRGGHVTRFGIEYDALFTGASYLSATSGRQRFVFPNSVIPVTDASGNVTYQDNKDITVYTGGVNFWNGVYKQGRANQVISAASWRLRELSLGYELPKKVLNKVGFLQRASVSLVGRNLFMWTPKTNIFGDPDFTGAGGNSNISGTSYNKNVSGMAGTNSTATRNYGFNLLLSF